MRSLKVSVIALVGLCGCGGRPAAVKNAGETDAEAAVRQGIKEFVNNSDEAELDAIWKSVTLPDSAHAVPEAPAPTISDADRPTSIDDFASQFVRLYQRDMYAPFIELAYWGSSTNEQKKEYLSDVRPIFTANATHQPAKWVSTEAIPIAQYESQYYYPTKGNASLALNPEPTHVLRIRASFFPPKADGETKTANTASQGNTYQGDDEGDEGDDINEAEGDEGV
ncbi:MAG TPA: hypothetical protein VG125_32615 [Pirellulales bacterium]|jgi:hypothetical protein|nr:hypothetical protein [Pirellulales bacterium]